MQSPQAGITQGDFLYQIMKNWRSSIIKFNPMGRVVRAREIKGLAAYLGSDASSYITNQVFVQNSDHTA